LFVCVYSEGKIVAYAPKPRMRRRRAKKQMIEGGGKRGKGVSDCESIEFKDENTTIKGQTIALTLLEIENKGGRVQGQKKRRRGIEVISKRSIAKIQVGSHRHEAAKTKHDDMRSPGFDTRRIHGKGGGGNQTGPGEGIARGGGEWGGGDEGDTGLSEMWKAQNSPLSQA